MSNKPWTEKDKQSGLELIAAITVVAKLYQGCTADDTEMWKAVAEAAKQARGELKNAGMVTVSVLGFLFDMEEKCKVLASDFELAKKLNPKDTTTEKVSKARWERTVDYIQLLAAYVMSTPLEVDKSMEELARVRFKASRGEFASLTHAQVHVWLDYACYSAKEMQNKTNKKG